MVFKQRLYTIDKSYTVRYRSYLDKVKDDFKKGSILLAELGGLNHVVHRLVLVDGDDLVLRGDAIKKQCEMCGRSDIIAEVVAVKRKGKMVRKGSFIWGYYRYLSYFIQAFNIM